MTERYILGAYWGPRNEDLGSCAERLQAFLSELGDCDVRLGTWYERGRSRQDALAKRFEHVNRTEATALLMKGRHRRDANDEVIDKLGFSVGFWNGRDAEQGAGLSITCGISSGLVNQESYLSNSVVISLPADLGGLRDIKRVADLVITTARVWDPSWAGVMSLNSINLAEFDCRKPFVDWVIFTRENIMHIPHPSILMRPDDDDGAVVIVWPTPPSKDNPASLRQVQLIRSLLETPGRDGDVIAS